MLRELDYGGDTAVPAGDGPMGDMQTPRLAGSDVPEERASAGALPPRSIQAGRSSADEREPADTAPERKSPLIRAVEIENFKGIGRPVRIELRPITLLFGRNSVGKSTVLHALCYAHEILSRCNIDVHETSLGGDHIDLGGFRQFVHRHDLDRSVRLRFELCLRDRELPELAGSMRIAPYPWEVGLGGIETGWVELTVRWSTERGGPILNGYEVGVDGEFVGCITASAGGSRANLVANLSHSMLDHVVREGTLAAVEAKLATLRAARQASEMAALPEVGQVRETPEPQSFGPAHHRMPVRQADSCGALPSFGHHLDMELEEGFDDYHELWHGVSTLLVGIGGLLRDALAQYRYIGPLRDLHPAAGGERGRSDRRRWADGSAAWDLLNGHARVNVDQDTRRLIDSPQFDAGAMSATVIRRLSDWLSREDRLDTGYRLQVRRAVHLPATTPLVGILNKGVEGEEWGAPFLAGMAGMSGTESPDDIMREAPDKVRALFEYVADAPIHREIQLVATRSDLAVRTSDIGVGISQLLPVVVAALDPDRPEITAIEQPELHVHPRLQVELGDLFATGAAEGNVFLIETHSEHLFLRIMRRMRETSGGTLPEGAPAVRPEDVNVLFVEPDGAETLIREMPLNEMGELVKAWPGGFFEEDLREIF